jgi:hypothetical protein
MRREATVRGLDEGLPSFDELEPEGAIADDDDTVPFDEAGVDLVTLEAWHENEEDETADGEAETDRGSATPVPAAALSRRTAKGLGQGALRVAETVPETSVENVPDRYWGASLQEDMRLMRALAKAASRAEERGYALALIAASVPLALRRYPELYGGLVALLPVLLHAAGLVVERWHGEARARARLARFPWLLTAALEPLARQLRQGRPVSAALAREALYQAARRAETR